MPGEMAAFFEKYRHALAAGDVDAMTACYRFPVPVVRPDRLSVIDDAAQMRDELRRIVDTWKWAGMTSIAMQDFRDDGFNPGMHVVSLVWRPLDMAFREITHVDVTYAVRRAAGRARIAAILAHNEDRRRVPLLNQPRGWTPYEADQVGVGSPYRAKASKRNPSKETS